MKKLLAISMLLHFLRTGAGTYSEHNKRFDRSVPGRELVKHMPASFIENKGQMTDQSGAPVPFVLYKMTAPGLHLYITEKGISYIFMDARENEPAEAKTMRAKEENLKIGWERIEMILKGANIKKENITHEGAAPHVLNYFFAHCPDGLRGVREYQKVTVHDVYPGIDWVLYNTRENGFKYDFIVHPQADPSSIRIIYSSLRPLSIDREGNVIVPCKMKSKLTEMAPYSYYLETKEKVESEFKVVSQVKNEDHFETEIAIVRSQTDNIKSHGHTLIIDPQLVWATFYGADNNDGPLSTDCDIAGNVFVTGYACSVSYPTMNSGTYYQGTMAGGGRDAMILKFSPTNVLLWATYYGGNGDDYATSVDVDVYGNIFVTGPTTSTNLPVQNSGTYFQATYAGNVDIFILKFDNIGTRLWATYYGGTSNTNPDMAYGLTTDMNGNLFVTGYTGAANFPLQNAGTYFQGVLSGTSDIFILKFDNVGNRLWATLYGGANDDVGLAVTCDSGGNLFLTGYTTASSFPTLNSNTFYQGNLAGNLDAFVLKFSNTGIRLWATMYGGTAFDQGISIGADGSGNVFVLGQTASSNLPVLNNSQYFQSVLAGGSYDMFILKFDNSGVRLWATYFGGNGSEMGSTMDNLAINSCGDVFIAFELGPSNISTLNTSNTGYFDNSFNGGQSDIFLAQFSNSGTLNWSTFYGGDGYEWHSPIAVSNSGDLLLSCEWAVVTSLNPATYPLTNPGAGAYYDGTHNGMDDVAISRFVFPQPLPATSFSYSAIACSGGTGFALPVPSPSFISGGSYSISGGLGINVQTGQVNWLNAMPGTYTISYTAPVFSCLYPANILTTTFVINASPTLAVNNPSLCAGTVATIQASASPSSGISYSWANQSSSAPVLSVSPLSTSMYTLIATTISGCSSSIVSTVSVMPNPTVSISAQDSICAGLNATLIAVSSSTALLNYSWPQFASSNFSLVVTPVSNSSYTLLVSSAFGCTATAVKYLTVNPLPTISISGQTAVCVGEKTTLQGTGAVTYTWSNGFNGSAITVNPGSTAGYTLTGRNAFGCESSTFIQVKVDNCTGLENALQKRLIRIVPNPNYGEFTLESDVDMVVHLENALGQLIRVITLSFEQGRSAQIGGLSEGVYYLRGETGGQKLQTKIVVRK